jgi:hypothetical protein
LENSIAENSDMSIIASKKEKFPRILFKFKLIFIMAIHQCIKATVKDEMAMLKCSLGLGQNGKGNGKVKS